MGRCNAKMAKRKGKAKKEMSLAKIGNWVFLVSVIIALLAGVFISGDATVTWILAILGIIVGLINVGLKDEVPFLIAAIALMVASQNFVWGIVQIPQFGVEIGEIIGGILGYLVIFVAPAAVIVALKAIYAFAREE